MAFQTQDNDRSFIADGIKTAFAFPILFFEDSHLQVYVDGVLQPSGITITGAGDPQGGTVTFAVAPLEDALVTILRVIPFTQPTAYPVAGPFPAEVTETAFDRVVMMIQQLKEQIGRAITIPPGTADVSVEIPNPTEAANVGKFLRAAPDASGFEFIDLPSAAPFPYPGTTAGDIIVHNGGPARLPIPVGGEDDRVLMTDSLAALKVSWKPALTVLPRGYLFGWLVDNDPANLNNQITVTKGEGVSDNDDPLQRILLTTSLTFQKDITQVWVAGGTGGTAAGGRDSTDTLAAGQTYFVYVFRRSGGVDDVFISTKANPVFPDGGTRGRRVFRILYDGTKIRKFLRGPNETVYLADPVKDVDEVIGTLAAKLHPLTVPKGEPVEALISMVAPPGSPTLSQEAGSYISPPGTTDVAPTELDGPAMLTHSSTYSIEGTAVEINHSGYMRVVTDAAGRIRVRASGAGGSAIVIHALGWIERRGQEALIGAGGAAGVQVESQGAGRFAPGQNILNFTTIDNGVTVTEDAAGGKADIAIPGGAAGDRVDAQGLTLLSSLTQTTFTLTCPAGKKRIVTNVTATRATPTASDQQTMVYDDGTTTFTLHVNGAGTHSSLAALSSMNILLEEGHEFRITSDSANNHRVAVSFLEYDVGSTFDRLKFAIKNLTSSFVTMIPQPPAGKRFITGVRGGFDKERLGMLLFQGTPWRCSFNGSFTISGQILRDSDGTPWGLNPDNAGGVNLTGSVASVVNWSGTQRGYFDGHVLSPAGTGTTRELQVRTTAAPTGLAVIWTLYQEIDI